MQARCECKHTNAEKRVRANGEEREESNNSEGDEGQMETPEKHMFSHLYLLETTLNGLDSIREACM